MTKTNGHDVWNYQDRLDRLNQDVTGHQNKAREKYLRQLADIEENSRQAKDGIRTEFEEEGFIYLLEITGPEGAVFTGQHIHSLVELDETELVVFSMQALARLMKVEVSKL